MYIGAIYQLSPAQGGSGQVVTVKIPVTSPARFRSTSIHQAYFKPMNPPPGVAYGAPGVTFFGYRTSFQRVDDLTAIVVIPALGTNPLTQMTPGLHKLVVTTSVDWAESDTAFRAVQSAPAATSMMIPLPASLAAPGHHPWAGLTVPSASVPTPGSAPILGMLPIALHPTFIIPSVAPTPATSVGPAPSSTPPAPPETTVTWLSETFTPHRTGPGPVMMKIKGVKTVLKPVPVEGKGSPPVRQFDFIVSAQLKEGGQDPVQGKRVHWELLANTLLPHDDTELLEVSNKFRPLQQKLKNNQSPSHALEARTNAEGKTYCWIRLRLFDERKISDPRQYLRGFKIVIGEPEEVPEAGVPGGAGAGLLATPTGTGAPAANPPWWQQLANVLVEPFEQAATTAVHWVDGKIGEAVAALPRTWQEVIGFALKRFADGFMLMSGIFPAAAAQGYLEQARAAVIGVWMGIPRGIWVMARDQVQDIKSIAFDLPRAIFNFIAEDPKFALEVLASIPNPALGQVAYALDPDFRKKIDESLARFAGLAQNLGQQIEQLWSMVSSMPAGSLISAIGDAIYQGFKDFVGDIATDYLRYAKDSRFYEFFVGAFMAGDFLGYILGTIGVQVLVSYLTAGIGTWVSGMAKIARLQTVANLATKAIDVFRQLEAAVKALGVAVKAGIGRVLLAFARFFEALDNAFIEPVVNAFHRESRKLIQWLHRVFETGESDQLAACARALAKRLSQRAGDARRVIRLLADFAEQQFVAGC
jgi:hypothetical protein